MPRPSRCTAAVTAAGALLVTAATQAPTGAAESPSGAPPSGATDVVTLVTGDTVHVAEAAGDRRTVTVEPADRAGDQTPGFHQHRIDGDLYVVPADVAAYVPDLLDRELFNVTSLIEQGLDDDSIETVPVIVDYADGARADRQAAGLASLRPTDVLESISAVAAEVSKASAAEVTRAVTSTPLQEAQRMRSSRTGVLAGVEKIWLDRQMTGVLEESAPQIGAPDAWDAGLRGEGITVAVLDTGIDSTHPDLTGKVVAEENFSTEETAADGHGHGTHVASTIAGSGAASDGARKGIAHGADLMNGKVLNDGGSGATSDVIAGMEWAAEEGADIVNLSLGAGPTDGTDPASLAVDNLTDEHGTLFVIAAGNDGALGDMTVSAPGAADRALTVGAVDKSDVLAGFSSTGPRVGDYALKPDITAPGVDIVAARADGTSMGSPVDADYTSANGTSMATPHVAGAAALLMQQRPEWSGTDVKNGLSSTAEAGDATVYEQGHGRVDLTRATGQGVYATSGSLSMGYFPYPQDDVDPVTRTITYRNVTDQDVSLALAHDVTDEEGSAPADGMLGLGADSVTVPAGGTADVDVTLDASVGDFGLYGGQVTATDDNGTVVRTSIGFYKESERYDLTVEGTARDGRPAGGISLVDVINVDDREQFFETSIRFVDGEATVRVPPGNYAVMGYIFTYDEPHVYTTEMAATFEPEVEIAGDRTIELDASDAEPIELDTADPTEAVGATVAYWRPDAQGASYSHSYTFTPRDGVFAKPTDEVSVGDFEFYSKWELRAPAVEVTMTEPEQRAVDAEYAINSSRLDGHHEFSLVDAGYGRTADFADIDVEGEVALIERGADLTFAEKVRNAEEAGAAAVMLFNNRPGLLLVGADPEAVPTLTTDQEEGQVLRSMLAEHTVSVALDGTSTSPYLYDLVLPEPDAVPDVMDYVIDESNTARLDIGYHSHVPDHPVGELRHKWRPWETFSFGFLRDLVAPQQRTEYVSSGDTRWQQNLYGNSPDGNPFGFPMRTTITTYDAGEQIDDSWLKQVARPATTPEGEDAEDAAAYRSGDSLQLAIPAWVDAGGKYGYRTSEDSTAFRLYENGEQIAEAERAVGEFEVGADPAEYRLELDVSRAADWWSMSNQTSTVWTVPSAAPDGEEATVLPLLDIDYDVDVDLLNRATTRQAQIMDLTVRHQPGSATAPISGARAWLSYDDGGSWAPAKPLSERGDGEFRVIIPPSQIPADAEHVSLRVEAWDSAGSRVEQEVMRAYGLR